MQNRFFDAYLQKLTKPEVEAPDPNLISAVLALRFGQSVVLLGGDALRPNWESLAKHFRKRALPKAQLLKVPHHGARNSFNLQKGGVTYLDLCSSNPKAKSVLFAGDSKHSDRDVYARLRQRTDTMCLSNGTRSPKLGANPLRLQIPGARVVRPAPVCNPVISFELDTAGTVTVTAGTTCDTCPLS